MRGVKIQSTFFVDNSRESSHNDGRSAPTSLASFVVVSPFFCSSLSNRDLNQPVAAPAEAAPLPIDQEITATP